jgi:protein-disulfide isomerase
MNRRRLLRTLSLVALASLAARLLSDRIAQAATQDHAVDVDAILNDPEAPVGGNPNGDVTIVAFIDYNCPFCKKSDPDLQRLAAADGKIKLIYKDWPILAEASVNGARLALAAKYQGKYEAVHAALFALHAKQSSKASMLSAVKAAGVDMTQLDADLNAHGDAISDLLKRNAAQADALGLKGPRST